MVCKTFGWSLAVTILALVVAFLYGPEALILAIILGILQVSLSFVDASFSFDGVIGAFALTFGPIIIGATRGPRRRRTNPCSRPIHAANPAHTKIHNHHEEKRVKQWV